MSYVLIVFYQEPAPYFLENMSFFAQNYEFEVHIFHYPVNREAPFKYGKYNSLHLHDLSQFSLRAFESTVNNLKPKALFLTTWRNFKYLKLTFLGNYNRILGIDNAWFGTPKQYLFSVLFHLFFKPRIQHIWVPGSRQVKFARQIGFKSKAIATGAYCCDLKKFNPIYSPEQVIPKRLLFAGRYVEQKGLLTLLEAFQELNQDTWELHCIGTGPLREGLPEIRGVKHLGFVQPEDLPGIMREGGVFVLPSTYEPWGVVVHEFAAAGFPMILSDQVGAGEAFLEEGRNGFIFKAGNKEALKKALRSIMQLSEDQLRTMGAHSHRLAQKITPETWAATLNSMLHVRP